MYTLSKTFCNICEFWPGFLPKKTLAFDLRVRDVINEHYNGSPYKWLSIQIIRKFLDNIFLVSPSLLFWDQGEPICLITPFNPDTSSSVSVFRHKGFWFQYKYSLRDLYPQNASSQNDSRQCIVGHFPCLRGLRGHVLLLTESP